MIWSLSETLTFIRPYVPDRLISPLALAHAQTVAERLPDAFTAHYFECRLASSATQVDFSTCVLARNGGRELLLAHDPTTAVNNRLLDHSLWRGVRRFVRDWVSPTSPLYDRSPLIWLEFDALNEPLLDVPLPGFNLCLDPGYIEQCPPPKSTPAFTSQCEQALVESTFANLLGHPIPQAAKENLSRCFDRLPTGGQILYVSAMLSRQPATLKLNGLIRKADLLAYLAAIGWPGSVAALQNILMTYGSAVAKIRFDLTVGPTMSPRIGIEFFSKGLPQSTAERHRLLDQLVENGLCPAEKREALLTWAGFSRELYHQHRWPTRLSRSWYIKLVYNADQSLEAKAYLGFTPAHSSPFTFARTVR